MKTITNSVLSVLGVPCMISVAFADYSGRTDNSSLVIWSFLGFCALIVIAQVVPAIRNARRVAQLEKERKVQVRMRTED